MIRKIRGTQDFLDLSLYNFVNTKTKQHLKNYHFHQIATPILEPLDLFVRSLGQETDVVNKEMFIVKTGKESNEAMCLRPEGTAPIVRAFIEHGIDQTPWKVFSSGPMFRYERPQKGRYRQFHQITCEIIGAPSIAHDVQLIKMLDRLFSETFSLDNFALLINFLGCKKDRDAFKQTLDTFLTSIIDQLCSTCVVRKEKNILRVFDCKNPTCKDLYTKAPFIADHLCDECDVEWQQVQEQLDLLSVSYTYSPSLVRGLDYYDKTAFEFVSNDLGSQHAFCGGGRYDHLVKELGSKQEHPALGAAIGIERLMLLLEPRKETLALPEPPALHIILPMGKGQQTLALLLADELQAKNLCADVLFDGSFKSMMRKANKMGAKYVLIIGSDEQEAHEVTLKNMVTGEEQRVKQVDVVTLLKK